MGIRRDGSAGGGSGRLPSRARTLVVSGAGAAVDFAGASGFFAASSSCSTSDASALAAEGFHSLSAGAAAGSRGAAGAAAGDVSQAPREAAMMGMPLPGVTAGPPRGERRSASSGICESGFQSARPLRHASVSGPMAELSQRDRSSSKRSGPACCSPMATYHSTCSGSGPAAGALSGSLAGGASGSLGFDDMTLSSAAPISSSRARVGGGAAGSGGGAPRSAPGPWVSSRSGSGRFTKITLLQRLQRTLTPAGPTLSSEIMYWARQLSQTNFIPCPDAPALGKNPGERRPYVSMTRRDGQGRGAQAHTGVGPPTSRPGARETAGLRGPRAPWCSPRRWRRRR